MFILPNNVSSCTDDTSSLSASELLALALRDALQAKADGLLGGPDVDAVELRSAELRARITDAQWAAYVRGDVA